ncbi:MAG: DUF421 domain-containing protein [Bacillota bacterium]|nr:DUF421 domain-containing protein [Bacillota bacterium]
MKILAETFIRTIILYFTVLFMIRIMGKREIGQLSAFDLVVAIMIAELAAIPMEKTEIPLHIGVLPIATLVIAEMILAKISLKSEKLRAVINGTPSVVIEKGVILQDEMRKLRFNINDLLAQLRQKDVSSIEDVEYAILETSGKLSIILKPENEPVTKKDLAINAVSRGLPMALITDGHLSQKNLQKAHVSEDWLLKQIQKQGYQGFDDVFLASLDEQGNLYLSAKQLGSN